MQSIEKLPNGLDLIQDDDFFKLGQDSILLSDFAKPRKFANVLDLCAGVGTLSFLCWRADLKITGLELQDGAVQIFNKSIEHNKLDNIKAVQGDLKYIRNYFSHGSIDYVVCNPPYFKSGSGKVKALDAHALARMDGEATIEDVAVATSYVLKSGGKCAMVFRPERLITLITALERVRLTPKRLRFVHQTSEKNPSAVLIECRKGGSSDGLIVEPPLIVNNADGTFTEEYLKIYNK